MKNLRLIPDTNRPEPIVKASFAYDQELITLIKPQKGAPWSQTIQSWCFSKKEKKLPNLISKNEITKRIGHIQAQLVHGK